MWFSYWENLVSVIHNRKLSDMLVLTRLMYLKVVKIVFPVLSTIISLEKILIEPELPLPNE